MGESEAGRMPLTPNDIEASRRRMHMSWPEMMEAIGEGSDEVMKAMFGLGPMPEWMDTIPNYVGKWRDPENHTGRRRTPTPLMVVPGHKIYWSAKDLADDLGLNHHTVQNAINHSRTPKGLVSVRMMEF